MPLLSLASTVCIASAAGPTWQEKPSSGGNKTFIYDRASPSVRWPDWNHQKLAQQQQSKRENVYPEEDPYIRLARLATFIPKDDNEDEDVDGNEDDVDRDADDDIPTLQNSQSRSDREHHPSESSPATVVSKKAAEYLLSLGKKKRARRSRVALLRATDWRERVQRLSEAVCELEGNQFVADLLNKWPEQLTPTDYAFVVKQVGYTHWPRALELFEWLNLKHWYTPNNRMLSTILGVLGRANQVDLAEEIFQRVEPELGDCVQVYNAMLSVHARQGNWDRMQDLVKIMLDKGCERDLVTYNTLVNGRAKAGLQPGMPMELLREIWQAGLRPDTVTYNTLISVASLNKCYEDAVMVYQEMKDQGCQADIWTYNSIISVYGRCGLDESAEEVYKTMQGKGFSPDPITYNSILFAYARKGRLEDVEVIRKEMQNAGCAEDEITMNTLIKMYCKKNLHEQALAIYEQMKDGKSRPDSITFVVLIDGLGKAGLVQKAERVFEEMVQASVKPSLNTFCAMICAYSKAGMYVKAVDMYEDMLEMGIQPDALAYSVMLDVFLHAEQAKKTIALYERMLPKQKPSISQCAFMLQLFKREGMNMEAEKLSEHMLHFGFNSVQLCSCFTKAGLCNAAGRALQDAVLQGQKIDSGTVDLLLKSYTQVGRVKDAQSLISSIPAESLERIREQFIVILANAEKFDEAKEELEKLKASSLTISVKVYRSLIVGYELAGMSNDSVQMFQEMQDMGLSLDFLCCRSAFLAFCRLGRPEEAHALFQHIEAKCGDVRDSMLHLALVKAYIKSQQWHNSELAFMELKETGNSISPKEYSSLLVASAQSGSAGQVLNMLKQMVKDAITPSSDTVNTVFEALLSTGRLVEVDEAYLKFQELGVDFNMQTKISMLNAYAKNADVEKANNVYQELRNAGLLLPVEVFNVLVGMFCKAGQVGDAECILKDMQDSGHHPNIFSYNSMLSGYSKVRNFRKAAKVFQGMQIAGCKPDTVTYNTLIHLYSRCLHTQEAHTLLHQMKDVGCVPNLASYTLLINAYGQMQMWEGAKALYEEMQSSGIQTDEATYRLMLTIYRRAGRPELAQDIVNEMKKCGMKLTIAILHMLMDSYGKGGQTETAEAVFESMVDAGLDVNVVQYTCLIDAYLKELDYEAAVLKLKAMESKGVRANHITWTCVMGAASKCEKRENALMLLRALRDSGFALPYRLLTENDSSVVEEVGSLIETLLVQGPGAGSGVLNVLQDLLWAFQKRSTAAEVFKLAVEKNVYDREFTRVNEGQWEADLCKLSPGAALVALTLWLIQMQEASLLNSPMPSKNVFLTMGSSKRSNHISISRTVKAHLWEMGAPFIVSKTREGVLLAKGYSVQHWLKDSPRCLDLELEDRAVLPSLNSMLLYEGAWMPRDMVPVFKQIEETMGSSIRARKFRRYASVDEERRIEMMTIDIQGRAEKLAKDKIRKQKALQTLPERKRWSDDMA